MKLERVELKKMKTMSMKMLSMRMPVYVAFLTRRYPQMS